MLILDYLSFLFRSQNRHGVHSPFVYNLNNEGLNRKLPKDVKNRFEAYNRDILGNTAMLKPSNFGAGSVFSSKERRVKEEAKRAGSLGKKAKILSKLSLYFKPQKSLELGTSLGLGTAAILSGFPNQSLCSVEGDPQRHSIAESTLKNHFPDSSIRLVNGDFDNFIKKTDELYDLIFIDGNHSYDATLNYFNWAQNHINEQGMIIFDDIYWSKGMKQAWAEIIRDKAIHVSIDLFYLGIVWLRPQQRKQHFYIRT